MGPAHMAPAGLSRETMLAAACCRWPPSSESDAAIRDAASGSIDWDFFLGEVGRHRIHALVWAGLRHAGVDVPAHVGDALSRASAGISFANLRHAAEEARLFRAFQDSGVDLLFVKGTTGAVLAFGSLAIKAAWDIDLLVAPADSERACALLAGLGYERRVPDSARSETQCRRWLDHSKEMLWINPALGIAVELHVALVDNPHLLGQVGMSAPRQIVRHGQALALPTLATEELAAYLCVHGTRHLWARLKWLADLGALIETAGLDCERLYRSSVALGAGRSVALALLLCNRFFGVPLPGRLAAELRADRGLIALERRTLAAIAEREGRLDDAESASQALRRMAALFLIKPSWRYRLAELRYRLFFPYRPGHLSVWPALWPILTLLHFPRFVLKRIRLGPRRAGISPES